MPTKVDSRVKELTAALSTKAAEIEGLSGDWKFEDGDKLVISSEQHEAYVKAVNEGAEIKALLDAEEIRTGIREYLDAPAGGPPAAGTDAAAAARGGMAMKSLAAQWLESEQYKEIRDSGFRRFDTGPFTVEAGLPRLAELGGKDVFSAMGGNHTLPALGHQQDIGLIPRQLRPGRIRDLFPAESTTANLLYGIRETGFTNNARVVPERTASDGGPATGGASDVYGLKPKSDLTLVPVTYPIATIAHIMYAHRNTLADEPRMQGLINRDMIDGVKLQEDFQLLYGDGIGDNLTGLVNTPGLQIYGKPSDTHDKRVADRRSAQVRRAITRVSLAFFQATGVVVHPLDWEDLELEQDLNGAYVIAISVALGGEKRVWRLNVVDTPAINEGQYLVGAFGLGAKVYDREQVSVQVSTENRDMFERNVVTLRGEERIGIVVDRPESFVLGSFYEPTAPTA